MSSETAFTMRLRRQTYARFKALSGLQRKPMRQLLEVAAQEYFDRLPKKTRQAIDALIGDFEGDETGGPSE